MPILNEPRRIIFDVVVTEVLKPIMGNPVLSTNQNLVDPFLVVPHENGTASSEFVLNNLLKVDTTQQREFP